MNIIGLTGGIGSGKSLVCRMLTQLNVPCFIADEYGRKVLDEDAEVRRAIKAMYGEAIYEHGKANRKAIAQIVFNDPKELERLNAIIHPAVKRSFALWFDDIQNRSNSTYCVRESAILFETGLEADCSATIAVVASEPLRIERVMKRDDVDGETIEKRLANQWNDEQRSKRADYLLRNEAPFAVIPQVMELHQRLSVAGD